MQALRIWRTQAGSIGRAPGPDSPPTITQSMPARGSRGIGPSSGSTERNLMCAAVRRSEAMRCVKEVAEDAARQAGAVFLYTRCGKNNKPMLSLNAALGYEAIAEEGHYMRLRKRLAAGAW